MKLSVYCHHCARNLECADGFRGYVVSCPDCTDPMGDSLIEGLEGRGSTPEDALQNWFDRREELGLEPELALSRLTGFIVPKSPEGWRFSIPGHGWDCVADTLAVAEGYARSTHSHGPLPIHYGPAAVQKKAIGQ